MYHILKKYLYVRIKNLIHMKKKSALIEQVFFLLFKLA